MVVVVGIDPGRVTGVAFVAEDGAVTGQDHRDPIALMRRLLSLREDTEYVIERYYGGGLQSSDGEHTLQLVGYFEYRLREGGRHVAMQPPQARRHKLSAAKVFFPSDHDRHKADALAHALVHIEHIERR